jgi:hypothetical protein
MDLKKVGEDGPHSPRSQFFFLLYLTGFLGAVMAIGWVVAGG